MGAGLAAPDLAHVRGSGVTAKLSLLIIESGYVTVYKDRINKVFVRNEDWARAFDLRSR